MAVVDNSKRPTHEREMNAKCRTDWKATALSPHSRRIEDSLLRNAAWEEEKLVVRAKDIRLIAGKK